MKMLSNNSRFFVAMKPGTVWDRTNYLVPTKSSMGVVIPPGETVVCRVVKRHPKEGVQLMLKRGEDRIESWLFWPRPGGDVLALIDLEDRIEITSRGQLILTYFRRYDICTSCSGYGWLAVNENGDPDRPNVERCGDCERYESDGHARVALYESWFAFEKARRVASGIEKESK